jgi:hypothetical protein
MSGRVLGIVRRRRLGKRQFRHGEMPKHRRVTDPASGLGVIDRSLGGIQKQCQARGEAGCGESLEGAAGPK